ncbi:MAG: copper chaperone [Bacteroidota bacterium]|nr:copper chaperone [Bacteroidota bacterium]
MKTKLLTIPALFIASFSFGQQKAIQKAVISTPGVRSEACKTNIDNRLVHEYGISSVKADYKRHTVTVAWFTDRTNIENVKTAIANMGYDANDVTAEPEAYKHLGKECQNAPEEKK